ncbi:senecionine N-oxygenase-like [Teleopsis dalmanni]|uniref:senecionine N-oxygenase-like n=1 Tax=Teleopsis dalmanni TaxID=139649 RepID=UPI0018CDEED8|nr:senecionine N-oxygenase-like [Teleopsis dalmanni]XP_037951502.1 senecionine N-oxygenase-like [Teleopsis dalmanni]
MDPKKLFMRPTTKRVLIIGAGAAGLCALKRALEYNMEPVVYEQTDEIGGYWNCRKEIPSDKSEEEINCSTYEDSFINLPKELMEYPDYQYSDQLKDSFILSMEVLNYLHSYAEHFALRKYIKILHEVIRVRRRNGEWEAFIWNTVANSYDFEFFDYVFVCTGHNRKPYYPNIPGRELYKGKQMNCHLYRTPQIFKDTNVLIVCYDICGLDIVKQISKTADTVYLSHNFLPPPDTTFMSNVIQKPYVKELTEAGAVFLDDSQVAFSNIIYYTGYQYSYPCLSTDCDLRLRNNRVYPLYKHIININNPTMALIGIPTNVIPLQLYDLQVRFALQYFTYTKELPSAEEMLREVEETYEKRLQGGLTERQSHQMGELQYDYYKELSETADIENIKPVVQKIRADFDAKNVSELESYRNSCYEIIDNHNFVKCTIKE